MAAPLRSGTTVERDIITAFFSHDVLSRRKASNSAAEARRQTPDAVAMIGVMCCKFYLPAQLAQVLVASLDAFDRLLGMVVLNNVMLDSRLVGVRENALPIDHAA